MALMFTSSPLYLAADGFRLSRKSTMVACANTSEEFGAREPFHAEVESNFGEKVIGNFNTEHVILIPSMPLSLLEKKCRPIPPSTPPITQEQARPLLLKVVGWRVVNVDGALRLECEWKLKSFSAGVELFSRIAAVAEAEAHYPRLCIEQNNIAKATLWTTSIDGLSENDFILAAKIDKIDTRDLINKRNKVWA